MRTKAPSVTARYNPNGGGAGRQPNVTPMNSQMGQAKGPSGIRSFAWE